MATNYASGGYLSNTYLLPGGCTLTVPVGNPVNPGPAAISTFIKINHPNAADAFSLTISGKKESS